MRTLRMIVTLFMVLTLMACTACGSKTDNRNQGGQAAPPAGKNQLETIKQSGKLRIGTEGTYAPFTYHDSSGTLTGFDVELGREIAKRLGVQPEFIETKWDGMIAGLDAKRFDVVMNEVSINDERKAKYDFSDPYIVSRAVLIVKDNNKDIKKLADLKGKKAGETLTSNLNEIAKKNGAAIVQIDGFNQAIDLLLSGRIDATVNDKLSYLDFKKHRPDASIKVVDETDEGSSSAVLMNKNNKELQDAINQALADIKKDGTYQNISQKYFGTDVSK